MNDQVLDILKLALLGLLYLFFARVLWAVWSEVRAEPARADLGRANTAGSAAPVSAPASPPAAGRTPRRGKRGTPARLTVLEPRARRGTTVALDAGAVSIGREADNTIVISDDAYVSGRHALLGAGDGTVTLTDLGSRNGTLLNGAAVTRPMTVRIGDRIQIGQTVLEAQ